MTGRQTEDFERHRSLLFSIAYRMLGSVTDAEDMVQEAYLRWREVPEAEVRSPKSYLSAVVTSLDRPAPLNTSATRGVRRPVAARAAGLEPSRGRCRLSRIRRGPLDGVLSGARKP